MITDGKVDAITFGTGTGGTLAGLQGATHEKKHPINVCLFTCLFVCRCWYVLEN